MPQDEAIVAFLKERVQMYQDATNVVLDNLGADYEKHFEFRTYSSEDDLIMISMDYNDVGAVFNVTHGVLVDGDYDGFMHAGVERVPRYQIIGNLRDVFDLSPSDDCYNYGCGMDSRGAISAREAWDGDTNGMPRNGSIADRLNDL